MIKKGHKFKSETDSEVIAHLIEEFGRKNDLKNAVIEALKLVRGTYGLAIISKKNPEKIIIARNGSPQLPMMFSIFPKLWKCSRR